MNDDEDFDVDEGDPDLDEAAAYAWAGLEPIMATDLIRDEGTVVLFGGHDADGNRVTFAVDHRPARFIAEALSEGLTPECAVPPYAVLRRG